VVLVDTDISFRPIAIFLQPLARQKQARRPKPELAKPRKNFASTSSAECYHPVYLLQNTPQLQLV
jgi:hypothetical protein